MDAPLCTWPMLPNLVQMHAPLPAGPDVLKYEGPQEADEPYVPRFNVPFHLQHTTPPFERLHKVCADGMLAFAGVEVHGFNPFSEVFTGITVYLLC